MSLRQLISKVVTQNPTQRAKANPSQALISGQESEAGSVERTQDYVKYFDTLEIVNRSISMIVDNAAEINYKIEDPASSRQKLTNIPFKKATVKSFLNEMPNPYQDLNSFRRTVLLDLLLDGNAFILVDTTGMYLLPARDVVIKSSTTTYVESYIYCGRDTYSPQQVIHIKDNGVRSIYRGESRLKSAVRTMKLMTSMRDFQDNFFKNGAVPGLVIESPDPLSTRMKERMKIEWRQSYSPTTGGRNPMILDAGLKLNQISNVSFKDLDFSESIDANEKVILKALGIPPVLVDSGNNANIRPNHRLYYLETILPLVQKICSAYQAFFGFVCYEDTVGIPALQAELKDEAAYLTSLVNGGIITPDEARVELGKEKIEGGDTIRVPQNIAGSASDPSQGGRPAGDKLNG